MQQSNLSQLLPKELSSVLPNSELRQSKVVQLRFQARKSHGKYCTWFMKAVGGLQMHRQLGQEIIDTIIDY